MKSLRDGSQEDRLLADIEELLAEVSERGEATRSLLPAHHVTTLDRLKGEVV